MSNLKSYNQLEALLNKKHADNIFKVDIFYKNDNFIASENGQTSKLLNPSDIATVAVNSIDAIDNVLTRVRITSDQKQKKYIYDGNQNEVRYENDEEKKL
jgi:hypothetical protein